MNYPRGSLWNKWDLHIHTPISLINSYGGDSEKIWDAYIDDLEQLPPEFTVLGINDYIFIDGYRKLLSEKSKGRLSNIDLLLPIIELRLDKFGGSSNKLSRVNLHIIFSNALSPDIIEQQFINSLKTEYIISPIHQDVGKKWSGVVTKDSLEELGTLIINSVPEEEKKNFNSPITEGFNNLNFSYQHICNILQNPHFKGKYITSVGKTEWYDIKWNDNSIADKKNIINSVHCVFISSSTYDDFYKSKDHLTKSKVNDKLIDCSDAHYFSNVSQKDRIGKCFTWIKADTTFEGLSHALSSYEERVFIGDVPPKVNVVNSNKTKYIKSLSIKKKTGSTLKEHWFDADIQVNHGLVSIIGNKGGGKSALGDIIGLLGNTRNAEWFSFLREDKFRKPSENKSAHFSAKMEWESGDIVELDLESEVNPSSIEIVKYIPQNYFEEICNELGDINKSRFDKEIKQVIYSHVPKADRIGLSSLGEIIEFKTQEIYREMGRLRERIQNTNKEIADLEEKSTEEYRQQINNEYEEKQKVLIAHRKSKPKEIIKPISKDTLISEEIIKLQLAKDDLQSRLDAQDEELSRISKELSIYHRLRNKLISIEKELEDSIEDFNKVAKDVGVKAKGYITYKIDKTPIDNKISSLAQTNLEIKSILDDKSKNSLNGQIGEIDKKIIALENKLDKPQHDYRAYQASLKEWNKEEKQIKGNTKEVGSLEYLQNELEELDKIPDKNNRLHKKRISDAKKIYKNLQDICEIYRSLYKSVQDFIMDNPDIRDKGALSFDVSIVNAGFQENFFDWIYRGATGSFYGADEGAKVLGDILSKYDYNDDNQTIDFIESILDHLRCDHRSNAKNVIRVNDQLRKGKIVESLYDYIFSLEYLKPRYILKMGDKELSELSPGERGTLLLIFYLLIDKNCIPLVIDQPEHNLDNETVYNVLVPAIKKAKKNRQIIIITHNPNLAVVCDSDQVIWASLNKKGNYKLNYITGAIENPTINKKLVDILEGTWPAFTNRHDNYLPQAQ